MFEQCRWINEPAQWRLENGTVIVTTDANTDFWRKTRYGFVRDNDHAFAARANDDFTAEDTVDGDFSALYDQARWPRMRFRGCCRRSSACLTRRGTGKARPMPAWAGSSMRSPPS